MLREKKVVVFHGRVCGENIKCLFYYERTKYYDKYKNFNIAASACIAVN